MPYSRWQGGALYEQGGHKAEPALYALHGRSDTLPQGQRDEVPWFCTHYEYYLYSFPKREGDTMTSGFQRFPDFGKKVRRSFTVHDNCYDCAAFYEGCKAWPAAKGFKCGHYQRLPDVMPGTCGQEFPEKVFVPANPAGERKPAKQSQVPPTRPAPRRPRTKGCRDCGGERESGHSYCSRCATSRKAHSNCQRQRKHRSRTPGLANGKGPDSGTTPLQKRTKALRNKAPVTG